VEGVEIKGVGSGWSRQTCQLHNCNRLSSAVVGPRSIKPTRSFKKKWIRFESRRDDSHEGHSHVQ